MFILSLFFLILNLILWVIPVDILHVSHMNYLLIPTFPNCMLQHVTTELYFCKS
jgi:hypothetical protein